MNKGIPRISLNKKLLFLIALLLKAGKANRLRRGKNPYFHGILLHKLCQIFELPIALSLDIGFLLTRKLCK